MTRARAGEQSSSNLRSRELKDIRREQVPVPVLPHQPEAEIVGRHAGRAAAGAGIADEVGHVGAMLAFDDADAAIGVARNGLAGVVEHACARSRCWSIPRHCRRGRSRPLLVGAEACRTADGVAVGRAAVRIRARSGRSSVLRDRRRRPAGRRPCTCCPPRRPIPRRSAADSARRSCATARPHRPSASCQLTCTAGRSAAIATAAVERAAGGFIDTALIVGGADLMLHDRKRLCEAHRQQRRFDLPAGAGEIAGHAVGHGAGMQLHDRLPIAQVLCRATRDR